MAEEKQISMFTSQWRDQIGKHWKGRITKFLFCLSLFWVYVPQGNYEEQNEGLKWEINGKMNSR